MAKGGNGGGGGNPGGGGSGNVIEFVILGLADDIASDSGTSQTDDITNIGSGFTLTGTIDPSIWPFTLVINGVEYTITEANIDDVTGEWSFTYPGDPLSPGTITVEAYYTTTHPRSNKVQTTSATPYSFELDTTAPDAPAGLTETGGVLSGLAEAGSAIQVYQVTAEGSTLIGTTAADGSGAWSYDLADAEGSFTAVAVDTAGNTSTTSDPIEVGGDTPNSPATIAGETTGGVTEDGTLTTGGTLIVTDPDTGESALAPASGPGAGGYGSFVINADGTWTYTLDNADPAVQALGDADRQHCRDLGGRQRRDHDHRHHQRQQRCAGDHRNQLGRRGRGRNRHRYRRAGRHRPGRGRERLPGPVRHGRPLRQLLGHRHGLLGLQPR
jgi:hypothetical protein